MQKITIRQGTELDIPALLSLIKELAIYEKAENEVIVNEEILLRDGFGPQAVFGFFVAEKNHVVIGIALYYKKYSTWKGPCLFLEDLIVTESCRKEGIGQLLFDAVAKKAKEMQVERLEWQVLNWNEPAIRFYKKNKAFLDDEWLNGKLTGKQLQTRY